MKKILLFMMLIIISTAVMAYSPNPTLQLVSGTSYEKTTPINVSWAVTYTAQPNTWGLVCIASYAEYDPGGNPPGECYPFSGWPNGDCRNIADQLLAGENSILVDMSGYADDNYYFCIHVEDDDEYYDSVDTEDRWITLLSPPATPYCRDSLEAGCIFESGDNILLTENEYDITPTSGDFWETPLLMHGDNIVLDCNGATLYFTSDYYGMIEMRGENNTLQNCNFERRYTEIHPEGCNCISDVTIRGMGYNNWEEPFGWQGEMYSPNNKVINCNFEGSTNGDAVSVNAEYNTGFELANSTVLTVYLRGEHMSVHDNIYNPNYLIDGGRGAFNGAAEEAIKFSEIYNNDFSGAELNINRAVIDTSFHDNIDNSHSEGLPGGLNMMNELNDLIRIYDNQIDYLMISGKTMNISNNDFWWMMEITALDSGSFVYGNTFNPSSGEARIYDFTDYQQNFITYCVDGVGNSFLQYDGDHPEQGTCCQPDWICTARRCENFIGYCTSVADQNNCGYVYNGDYSEIAPINCGVASGNTADNTPVVVKKEENKPTFSLIPGGNFDFWGWLDNLIISIRKAVGLQK